MNEEMHAESGMHKPRYVKRKRQNNIYNERIHRRIMRKISWGSRAWGWRVASFVKIRFYVCILVSRIPLNMEYSTFSVDSEHDASWPNSEVMYFCWAYEQKQIAVLSMGHFRQKKHLHMEIVGLLAFEVWCFVSLLVVAWQWVMSFLLVSISLKSWTFCKVFGMPIRLNSASFEQSPIQMLAPDRQIQIENPIVR